MAWYDKWAIIVIAAAIGVAGYAGIPWDKMDVTVWAYWVAAIGTVGTLIGTIWLATTGTRERRRRELDLALIVSASMIMKLTEIRISLRKMGEFLQKTEATSRDGIHWAHRKLSQMPTIEPIDLTPLVIYRSEVAMKLSALVVEIDWCKRQVSERDSEETGDFDDNSLRMIVITGRRLVAAGDRIQQHQDEIRHFFISNGGSII